MPETTPAPDKNGLSLVCRASLIKSAADGDEKKPRRFEIIGYTGEPMEQGWWDALVVVDLAGIETNGGVVPILDNHGPAFGGSMREAVVGQSDTAAVEGGQFVLRGQLFTEGVTAGALAAQDICRLADQGLAWQASIGARCEQKDFVAEGNSVQVNGRTYEGPVYVSRKTVVREVSFVVIGADGKTSAVVASGRSIVAKKSTFAEYCKSEFDMEPEAMSEKMKARTQAAYDAEPDDDDAKAKAAKLVTAKVSPTLERIQGGDSAIEVAKYNADIAANIGRVCAIQKICAANPTLEVELDGKKINIQAHAIAHNWDAEKTRMTFELETIRAERPAAPMHWYSPSTPQMNDAVLECAVLQAGRCQLADDSFYLDPKGGRRVSEREQRETQTQLRARYTDQVQQAAHTIFKGRIGLQQLLVAGARAGGYQGSDRIDGDSSLRDILRAGFAPIRADGASTVSVQNVLANVLNKFLLQGYLFAESAYKEICGIRPVKDFKPTSAINIFGDYVYKKLNSNGQIENAAMTDEGFKNSVDTFARLLTLTRKIIIDDDLSALTTVPQLMGVGAKDAENNLFWTVWLNGMGNGPDSAAFWATRGVAVNTLGGGALNDNYMAGSATNLSSASLQQAVYTYDKQVKPNGQPLGAELEILLVPPELWVTAVELCDPTALGLVYGGSTAAKQPNYNIWKGRFKVVKSRYISNTTYTGNSASAWWLLANPQMIPTIEMAYLNGQEQPTVQTAQADFDTLGISIRGFHDFGAAPQNTRGGLKSKGAA